MRRIAFLLAFIVFVVISPARAQSAKPLRVQTRLVTPFVIQGDNGKLTGFSVELWDAIAQEASLPSYTMVVSPSVTDQLAQVAAGKADLAIAATSITAERDAKFDFSQPFFNAGLGILVRGSAANPTDAGGALSPRVIFQNLFSPTVGKLFLWIMLLAVVAAHLIWLLERNHPEGLPETKRYFPGIFKSIWWAAATLGAQADEMPKTYGARIVAILLMFTSALFIAYFTAAVTAQITVQQLAGVIRGVDDLPGKRVATVSGSTAEAYLGTHGAKVTASETIDKAFAELQKGSVDAVVYDAPVLLYYAAHGGKDKTQLVGAVFRKEDYGIVFAPNSPQRKPVNLALLKLKENGTYDALYKKWFGDDNQDSGK